MIDKREDVRPTCCKYGIPDHMHGTVERYLFDSVPGGSFFNAVVSNDLVGAAGMADHMNSACLKEWASLLYNEFPSQAWGDGDIVYTWLSRTED